MEGLWLGRRHLLVSRSTLTALPLFSLFLPPISLSCNAGLVPSPPLLPPRIPPPGAVSNSSGSGGGAPSPSSNLSAGAIAGIVLGSVVGLLLIGAAILSWKRLGKDCAPSRLSVVWSGCCDLHASAE